ncbi:matrixin family metalloprotease [Streptomyces sp. NPDC056347]|uniref:matrixin family metalloprotease n=1 Tax=Streptomyces sp. NPDC056347 TaxID=3345790 RepID=UPI0035E35A93
MKHWKRILSALVITSAVVIIPASPAAAYGTLGCKFSTGTLKWQDATTTSGYATAATNAVEAWNSTSTQFNMNKVTSGANIRVASGNFGATWQGTQFVGITLNTSQENPVTQSCSGGTWDTTMVTWWNDYYTQHYGAVKRQAIMVHELGHALGLAHTAAASGSSCSKVSIMDRAIDGWYDACGFWTPRQDDINGANALY